MDHQHSPRFLKIAEDAKRRVRETNIDEVNARLDRGDRFVLVDIRGESEFGADHLPGAVQLSRGILERDIEVNYPPHRADCIPLPSLKKYSYTQKWGSCDVVYR